MNQADSGSCGHTSLQDDEPTIAERLEAYHEALLASQAAPAADAAMASGGQVAFRPDESALAIDEGAKVTMYRTTDWQLAAPPIQRPLAAQLPGPLAFSADGRLLAVCGSRREIQLRDARNLERLLTLEVASVFDVEAILFDRAGTRLMAVTVGHGVVNIWDLRSIRAQLADIGLDLPGNVSVSSQDSRPEKRLQVRLDLSALDSTSESADAPAVADPQ